MTERQRQNKNHVYLYHCCQNSPLCQQNLRGCRQTFNHRPTPFFAFFSFLHMLIGILCICLTNDVKEYKIRYDDKCQLSEDKPFGKADVQFANPKLEGNLFFYFELHDYYQTFFFNSPDLSLKKLRKLEDYIDLCESVPNTNLTIECRDFESFYFKDSFELLNSSFDESDISWRYERGNLYKSGEFDNATQRILHEHFMVWMRVSPNPDFRKLYARSKNGCPANLHVKVNCLYSYNFYKGKRYIVLLKPSGLGGRTWVLATFNLILFAILVVFIIIFEVSRFLNIRKMKRQELIRMRKLEMESQY